MTKGHPRLGERNAALRRKPSIPPWALIGTIVLIGAFLRLYRIDHAPIWIDEAYTILTAALPFDEIIAAQRVDSSPPLFYFLLHVWLDLFGNSETSLRLLSAVAGTALIATVYLVGRRHVSPQAGLAAALVLALSPIQIYYSRQVRMYALLALFALASVHFLVCFIQNRRLRDFIFLEAVTLACLYTHNYALFLLGAQAVLVALSGQLWKRRVDWAAMIAVTTLGYLPWLPLFLRQAGNTDPFAWYGMFWEQWGPLGAAWRTLESFSIGGAQPPYVGLQASVLGGALPAWLFAAAAILGVAAVARSGRRYDRAVSLWAPVFLVVPLLLSAASSAITSPNYAPGRVDQMVFPAFCLLVGSGIASIRHKTVRAIGIGLIPLLAGATLASYYDRDYRGEDRDLARFVSQHAAAGEPVLCTSLTRASLQHYLRAEEIEARLYSFPPSTAAHLGYQNDAGLLTKPRELLADARAALARVREQAVPGGHFVVVLAMSEVNAPLMNVLEEADDLRLAQPPAQFRQSVTGMPITVLCYEMFRGRHTTCYDLTTGDNRRERVRTLFVQEPTHVRSNEG